LRAFEKIAKQLYYNPLF